MHACAHGSMIGVALACRGPLSSRVLRLPLEKHWRNGVIGIHRAWGEVCLGLDQRHKEDIGLIARHPSHTGPPGAIEVRHAERSEGLLATVPGVHVEWSRADKFECRG